MARSLATAVREHQQRANQEVDRAHRARIAAQHARQYARVIDDYADVSTDPELVAACAFWIANAQDAAAQLDRLAMDHGRQG